MPMIGFKPTQHGFHFSNAFRNRILKIPGREPIETAGRCGGMAYAALDYYFAGIPIPSHIPADFPSGQVPADENPLARYIYSRLIDSFRDCGINFVRWTLYDDGDSLLHMGVTRLTKEQEIPKLRRQIDAGIPVALGLVKATRLFDIVQNHQVVAYGYDYDEASQRTAIYIYDNNYPDRNDIALVTDASTPHVREEMSEGVVTTWRGLFVQDYQRKIPEYKDITLVRGIWATPPAPLLGKPFQCGYTVKNLSEYPAHLQSLYLYIVDPAGVALDAYSWSDGIDTPLPPGRGTDHLPVVRLPRWQGRNVPDRRPVPNATGRLGQHPLQGFVRNQRSGGGGYTGSAVDQQESDRFCLVRRSPLINPSEVRGDSPRRNPARPSLPVALPRRRS